MKEKVKIIDWKKPKPKATRVQVVVKQKINWPLTIFFVLLSIVLSLGLTLLFLLTTMHIVVRFA